MSGDYHGLPVGVLENRFLRLEYLTSAGPRIVRLVPAGMDKNLLAEVPEAKVETIHGEFFFYGGHRLCRAPESPNETYIPDSAGLVVEETPAGVNLIMPVISMKGIAKNIAIRLAPDRPSVTLEHGICNGTDAPARLAPWASTMMRLGGLAILPQAYDPTDAHGVLPNRHLVLWPYSSWRDPRLFLHDEVILIRGKAGQPPIKLGYFNPHGWTGYWIDGLLFVKHYDVSMEAPHPDRDCNTEAYCNHEVLELESLGPLTTLAPGESVCHTEKWELYDDLDQPFITPAMRQAILSAGG
jgi:hypothetical protein